MYHCLNILMYTFKCTGKSSSIRMTARDDNDELDWALRSRSMKFQNVCLCVTMYIMFMWELVFSRTLHSP